MRLLLTVIIAMFSTATFADAIGLRGHAGLWLGDMEGSLGGQSLTFDEVSFERENYHQYAHLYVEHPVPLIPNVRLHYSHVEASRQYDAAAFEGLASARVDLTHVEVTAYYELLDNIVSLDAGLSARKYTGAVSVSALAFDQSSDYDPVLPMAYALVEVDFPLTGWSLGAEGSFTEYDDYRVSDYSARVRYLLDAVVKVGLEAGYREMRMEVDKSFGFDLTVSGPFAALAVHF